MSGVLVDTSVWVEHFRHGNARLVALLQADAVLTHPMVVVELACGTPPSRNETLRQFDLLGPSRQASLREVLALIEREQLQGLGCGLVDLVLLASTLLTPGATLWSLDESLAALARRFGLAHEGDPLH